MTIITPAARIATESFDEDAAVVALEATMADVLDRLDVVDERLDYAAAIAGPHRLTIFTCGPRSIGVCRCGWTSPVDEDAALVGDFHASHVDSFR